MTLSSQLRRALVLPAEEDGDPLCQVPLRRGPNRVLQGGWDPRTQSLPSCPGPARGALCLRLTLTFWLGARPLLEVAECVRVHTGVFACAWACIRVRAWECWCVCMSPHCLFPSPSCFVTQRCIYDTCNCQNNEDCMCAALSSYARACATKGVMLWGWRERVCSECQPLRLRGPGVSVGQVWGWPSLRPLSPVAAPEHQGRGGRSAHCSW